MKDSWLLSNIGLIWTGTTVALSLAIAVEARSIFAFKAEAPKYGVPTNPFTDLYVMGVALCAISIFRQTAMYFVRPSVERRLKFLEPGCTEDKIDKNTRAIVGSIWYTFTTVITPLISCTVSSTSMDILTCPPHSLEGASARSSCPSGLSSLSPQASRTTT